jgi:hypothetical protein
MEAPNLDGLIFWFLVGLCSIPFAIWKWIEIIVWVYKHVHIGIM